MLRKTIAGELERLLPRCKRVQISGAAHLMHEDNPAEFNAALLEFLAETGE